MARQLSGQITVTTAGTAVAGTDVAGNYFALKGHPSNTGTVWVGNDGSDDVSSANGFPLDPGQAIEAFASNLSALRFDADTNGDKVCWYRVE